jgi:hypothetical protein
MAKSKRATIYVTLKRADFILPDRWKELFGDVEEVDEIDVDGLAVPYSPGTWNDPPEGGYCEDITVKYNGQDLTDDLTEKAMDRINTRLYESLDDSRYDD